MYIIACQILYLNIVSYKSISIKEEVIHDY